MNFALTGAAGYIAPRHLKAIRDTGNMLVAACDPHDSVGILDSYFPDTAFFTEYERFDRHLEKLRRRDAADRVQYLSICSPNHLHDAHIRQALRIGAHAICEKPLVINPWNLDALEELEEEYSSRVYTILQLRLHPALIALKNTLDARPDGGRAQVTLDYVTARGPWYQYSWKGNAERSGGILANIGIHFFDMLIWLFGAVQRAEVSMRSATRAAGTLALQRADVRWHLSICAGDLPERVRAVGGRTHRSLHVDDGTIEFTDGFADLHTAVYRETLAGRGFGIADARASIELVHALRSAEVNDANDAWWLDRV